MPQGHRNHKSAGSDDVFHSKLPVAVGFCLLFHQGEMLNTLQG
ncbi:hypothetical protein C4A01_04394 [Escherichia coli]|nr:hypothetical protein C4A07_04497 [Escherichia coli]RDR82564.1 hypothetical protein C4A01_04394 [Escherichia coli]